MSPCWDLPKPKHMAGSCPVCNQPPWAPSLLALSAGELRHLTQLRPVTSTELPREWLCFESPHLFLRGSILLPGSSQLSRAEGPLWAMPLHTPCTHSSLQHTKCTTLGQPAPGSSRCHEPCTGHSPSITKEAAMTSLNTHSWLMVSSPGSYTAPREAVSPHRSQTLGSTQHRLPIFEALKHL